MLRRRQPVEIRPELDDRRLRRTVAEIRPEHQLHGLGADRTRPPWEPVAELLRGTGRNWDRRVHRVSVLARVLPPAVADRWAAERPGDGDALVMGAYMRALRAAEDGPAAVRRAEQACVRAAGAYPQDPTPWVGLLSLLRALRVPVRDVSPVWQEVLARDPLNRTAHHEVLRHLAPSAPGHGSLVEMTHFARQAAHRAPYGSPLVVLPLAARAERLGHALRGGASETRARTVWQEPGTDAEVDTALARWADSGAQPHAEAVADLNILAFALVGAGRADQAGPVFRRIGRHMTWYPWDLVSEPVETFRYWRDRGLARRAGRSGRQDQD